MGNQIDWVQVDNEFSSQKSLLQNLIFIESRENKNEMLGLGAFDIYRFSYQPYDYVMKHKRTFIPDTAGGSSNVGGGSSSVGSSTFTGTSSSTTTSSRCTSLLSLPSISHKLIARLHNIQIRTKNNLCMKETIIQSYSNYYALTLQQVVSERKRKDIRFTTGELWYILHSLIQLSIYLQKMNVYYGVYLPKNIHLSPEGYLKVYLYHLAQNNKHCLYYHLLFDRKEMHKYLPIPPQCLQYLHKEAVELKQTIDYGLMDCFGIGMICMEAMLFNSTRKYYQTSGGGKITFEEGMLKADLRELKSIYPPTLVNLIEKMVVVPPENRYTFAQCQQYIKSIREDISVNGTIKMVEDDENQIIPKVSYKSVSQTMIYHDVLRSIAENAAEKLQIVPIKSAAGKGKAAGCNTSNANCSTNTNSHTHTNTNARTPFARKSSGVSLVSSHSKKENKLTKSNLSSMHSFDQHIKSRVKPYNRARINLI